MQGLHRKAHRGSIAVCFVVIVLALGSCSSEAKRHDVSGGVTYGDKPVPAGQVFFDPDTAAGNTDGQQGFAIVKDGHYDTSQGGRGIVGGAYVIRVQGFDGKPGPELPLGKVMFGEYSLKAELPKNTATQDIKIPAEWKGE